MDFVINRFFMKLFKTNNIDHVKYSQHCFSFDIIIIIIIYLLGKQIQICSRGSNIAGTTSPKENITKKYKHEIRI